jgi:hypothetical protein
MVRKRIPPFGAEFACALDDLGSLEDSDEENLL